MQVLTLYVCRNLADVILAYTEIPDLLTWQLHGHAKQRAPHRLNILNPSVLTWHQTDALMAYIVRLGRIKGFNIQHYHHFPPPVRRFILLFNRNPRMTDLFVHQEVKYHQFDLVRTLIDTSLSFADGELGDLLFSISMCYFKDDLVLSLLHHPNFSSPERYLSLTAILGMKQVYELLLKQWTGVRPDLVVDTLTKVVRNRWEDVVQSILAISHHPQVTLTPDFKHDLIIVAVEYYPEIIPDLMAKDLDYVSMHIVRACIRHHVDVSLFQLIVSRCGYQRSLYDEIMAELSLACINVPVT